MLTELKANFQHSYWYAFWAEQGQHCKCRQSQCSLMLLYACQKIHQSCEP